MLAREERRVRKGGTARKLCGTMIPCNDCKHRKSFFSSKQDIHLWSRTRRRRDRGPVAVIAAAQPVALHTVHRLRLGFLSSDTFSSFINTGWDARKCSSFGDGRRRQVVRGNCRIIASEDKRSTPANLQRLSSKCRLLPTSQPRTC